MKLTTTFKLLQKPKMRADRYAILRRALTGVQDDEPISLPTILEHNGIEDAIWSLRATAEPCDKVARLMAADFAELALPIWEKYSDDKRP